MVGGPGFEPGLMESESIVLPLNDPPIISYTELILKRCLRLILKKTLASKNDYIVN